MFVKELIELLKQVDPLAEVRSEGAEPGDTWHVDGVKMEGIKLWPGEILMEDHGNCVLLCDSNKYDEWSNRVYQAKRNPNASTLANKTQAPL